MPLPKERPSLPGNQMATGQLDHPKRKPVEGGRFKAQDMKVMERNFTMGGSVLLKGGGLKVGEGWYNSFLPILRILNASGVT